MGQTIALLGIVLAVIPIGDYDKRITLLTRERGKITAFVKGARRQGSQMAAAANPFAFGEFEVYEGRTSYTVVRASISNYFRELVDDFESVYYGFYFLEIADYYTRENADEIHMLKLLYQSMRALEHKSLPNPLVRCIYEWKAMALNGEYPNVFSCISCGGETDLGYLDVGDGGMLCQECMRKIKASSQDLSAEGRRRGRFKNVFQSVPLDSSTLYTLQYIITAPVEKLYTFTVSEEVQRSLDQVLETCRKTFMDRGFQSLKILEENLGFAAANFLKE